jgi:DMSO/TMAO reductase YedYZ molybdopterin-dependent catalytic subunit
MSLTDPDSGSTHDERARAKAGRPRLAGFLAGALALSLTELATGALHSVPSLVGAVGDAVIDWLPPSVVRFGIETFGGDDKTVLVGVILLVCGLAAAALGQAGVRDFRRAVAGFVAFGVVGGLAALRDPQASALPVLASTVLAAAAGLGALAMLLRLTLRPVSAPTPLVIPRPAQPMSVPDRRHFLAAAGLVTFGSVVSLSIGRRLSRSAGAASRGRYVLPPVAKPLAAPPETASVGVPGVAPLIVPADRFYRTDTRLLGAPVVDADRWRLRVKGMVERPYELSFADLLAMPMVEEYVTLCCVSNEVGGDLVGNAAWRGVPLVDLLSRSGVRRGATQIVGRSVDGFTVGFPTDLAFDGRHALVAVGMNGDLLSSLRGFPARLVVPGLYGYVSATKWLTEIELTTWDGYDAYWVPRGWAKKAPIKTQSRIDTVSPLPPVAGPMAVAGVAWAPTRGIARVEVQVDDERWAEASLADSLSDDTWRQWVYRWQAAAGNHVLRVRATDGRGDTQTSEVSDPAPDGATGYHTVRVAVHETARAG